MRICYLLFPHDDAFSTISHLSLYYFVHWTNTHSSVHLRPMNLTRPESCSLGRHACTIMTGQGQGSAESLLMHGLSGPKSVGPHAFLSASIASTDKAASVVNKIVVIIIIISISIIDSIFVIAIAFTSRDLPRYLYKRRPHLSRLKQYRQLIDPVPEFLATFLILPPESAKPRQSSGRIKKQLGRARLLSDVSQTTQLQPAEPMSGQ